ncbi:MAG TPA: proton-conducting transporter membrane subunit [Candidatus Acidoferrum sp.]|nr:proton-conducting transporter membrane subunit [Candidatus Acidoferrum sp.]
MNTVGLALMIVFGLCAAGAVLGLAVPERWNPIVLAWAGSFAALSGLWASSTVLLGGAFRGELWTLPSLGTLSISLDRLSAFFLFISAIVVLASSVFSHQYMKRYVGHYKLSAFTAWYLLLFASITWILVADDVLGFLLAWEVMSILTYLLVNFEHQRPETNRAGYLMLAMGEAGFLAVEVVLLWLGIRAGAFDFGALRTAGAELGQVGKWAFFLLTFFGFGIKAGLVPLNSWLPRAHPAAPANVSAILSGVILNLGLYGIIRMNLDLVPMGMLGVGLVVLIVGTVSALVGILYATTESDLKALLAHSSIENIGIVTIGLGAGIIFASEGRHVLAGMAFVAGFYHMLNHSLYKALLFLGAGAVDDRAGTRDLDKLGGLLHAMPYTGFLFLIGSLAISAVPPLNGFTSEWLTLQTLLRSAELPSPALRLVFALCGAVLALTAALAVTCFVKAFAMGFLGKSRLTRKERGVTEMHASAVGAMGFLALLCLALGLFPTYVIPALSQELRPLISPAAVNALVPAFFATNAAHKDLPQAFASDFRALGAQVGQDVLPGRGLVVLHRGGPKNPVVFAMSPTYAAVALAIFLLLVWVLTVASTRKRTLTRKELWGGGIPKLLPQMSYTATGFSNPVRVVFQAIFRPNIVEDTRETVAVHFRTAIHRRREETHLVDRLVFHSMGDAVSWLARLLARMHHGRLNAYVAYSLGFLLILLLLYRLS